MKRQSLFLVGGLLTIAACCWPRCDVREAPQLDLNTAVFWSKEPLDGNDAPFKSIRQNIDRMIKSGKNKTALANAFKKSAQKTPKDAQAQFRWAYAAYQAQKGLPKERREDLLCHVYEWMGLPKNPRSFEYARLRFIISQVYSTWGTNQNLADLAKRLSLHSPTDYELKTFTAKAISGSNNREDRLVLSAQWARELQKVNPKRADTYWLLGKIYGNRFAIYKQSRAADQSNAFFRKYLQIAPKTPENRKAVEYEIALTERLRKRWKAKGELKP